MQKLKDFYRELPRPVQIWSVTILIALLYIGIRLWQTGTQEAFHLFDRVMALYAGISLIIFLGFFMTSDPE